MKKFIFIALVLCLLLLTRWLDFYAIWKLGSLELNFQHSLYAASDLFQQQDDIYYCHIGYSTSGIAKKKMLDNCNVERTVTVVSYYNLLHPSVYLIHNKGGRKRFILPWTQIEIEKGVTEVYFYKFDFAEIKSGNEAIFKRVEVGSSLFSLFFDKSFDGCLSPHGPFSPSTKYVDRIHIIYFYFPLVLIVFFSLYYSKRIFVCFYYYFIMLFLFWTPTYWFCPLCLAISISDFRQIGGIFAFLIYINFITYFLFYKGIKFGKHLIKERGLELKEKVVIWYILMLPLILRF